MTFEQLARQLGYEDIRWDAENDCWSGYGSSDPTNRTRDLAGPLYVAANDQELHRLIQNPQ